jgi:hypothetical protein
MGFLLELHLYPSYYELNTISISKAQWAVIRKDSLKYNWRTLFPEKLHLSFDIWAAAFPYIWAAFCRPQYFMGLLLIQCKWCTLSEWEVALARGALHRLHWAISTTSKTTSKHRSQWFIGRHISHVQSQSDFSKSPSKLVSLPLTIMSHPCPQPRPPNSLSSGGPHPSNPSNPTSSRDISSVWTNSHRQHGQQHCSNACVIPSPVTSQHPDEDNDLYDNPDEVRNQENDPEIEGTSKSKKQGLEMLWDALEEVLNTRQRRRGIKYTLGLVHTVTEIHCTQGICETSHASYV